MSQVPDVGGLFQTALDEGDISPQSKMVLDMVDVGAQIQGQIGLSGLDIPHTELFLVAVMPDDSGSIRFVSGNTEAVRQGHNGVIDALMESKQRDAIILRTQYLNGFVLNDWVLLENAARMDTSNFDPNLGTPLYDNSVVLLGSVIAEWQKAKANGQVARTGTLIVTDGHDEHSVRATARDVASVVKDMLMAETHIVAFMGIDDGYTDFRTVAKEMGIRDEWILTPDNDPKSIRRAFATFSSSMVRASQSGRSFSQTAGGGFTSN